MAQLGRLYPDFQAAGAEVLVILGDAPERAARYASTLKVPFPVLSDAAFDVYHQFGLQRSYFVIQRTASAIVDRTGTIRYLRRATNPQTWLAESRELLGIVQGLGGV